MRYLFFILSLISLSTYGQKYYGDPYRKIPEKIISLNDFGAKGDNSTSDAAIVEQVIRYADANGYWVTGYGTFNMNNDSIGYINNVKLWASNKGSFILKNGRYFTPKLSFQAKNVVFEDWTAAARGVCFWDTVKDAGGAITYDGWPELGFVLEVENCTFKNISNAFYCQQDPSPDSSSITGYIKNSLFQDFRYSAIKLPFKHTGFKIHNNEFTGVTNSGTNFSAVVNVGLDNTYNRGGSFGFEAKDNYLHDIAPDDISATTYGLLCYTNGGLWQGNQIKNVMAPGIYMAGDNNKAVDNILINDSNNISTHGIIVKGGISYTYTVEVSNNTVKGKYLTGIYLDHSSDKALLTNNTVVLDEDLVNVGQGALRILGHGFNDVIISGGIYESRQTNSSVKVIDITTDDTIYNLTITGATIIGEGGGIGVNSNSILEFNLKTNPTIYAKLAHTIKTAGTKAEGNHWYYPKGGTHLINLNANFNQYWKSNIFKPYGKDTATTAIGRIFNIDNDPATDSTYLFLTANEYDLSFATQAIYVQNPIFIRMDGDKLTKASSLTANFMNVRFNAGFMDVEAKNIDIPFGKQFITCGMGTAGQTAKLKIYNSFLTGSVVTFSSGTAGDITKDSLIIKEGSVPSTTYGSGWIFQDVPGAVGTGDFSSNTTTSVDGEIVLFNGTGGKSGKRATQTGFLKGAAGVLSAVSGIAISDLIIGGTPGAGKYLDSDGNWSTPSGSGGITSVLTDGTLDGDGNGTPLSVDTTSAKLLAFVQNNGGGGGGDYELYTNPTYFEGGDSPGNPLTLVAPGGTGAVGIKQNLSFVTGTTYNVLSTDVMILFTGTSATTFTMPSFNSTNHKRVLFIRNTSAVDINLNVNIYYNSTTSTSVIAPTESFLLVVDDTNDKIWVVLKGS